MLYGRQWNQETKNGENRESDATLKFWRGEDRNLKISC